MKKIVLIMTTAVAMLFAFNAFAATSMKMGVVNVKQVIAGSNQMQQARAAMQKQFAGTQQKIEAKQQDLLAKMKKLKRDGAVMRASDKEKLQQQISTERKALMVATQKFQMKIQTAQMKLIGKLIKQVKDAVKKVAQKQDLDLVLTSDAIAYSKTDLVDITKAVTKQIK